MPQQGFLEYINITKTKAVEIPTRIPTAFLLFQIKSKLFQKPKDPMN